ncbi:unnamed protein product [Pieris macdunnoughi]|uniref:Uncharacterized protein n=1 Tax=Pieris macdunnoughi TaxID=345717 RepID=A0A821PKZ3_9NEOP|nr:unnamed protein product [Pieris macdunnoughi]
MAKESKSKGNIKKKKRKRKLTCCQRCKRRIVKWFYRRTKRCCKKAIFGVPDPKLSDYDIAGVNLGDARDKLKINKSKSIKDNSEKKKPSIVTLYKSNKNKSIISIPFKQKLIREYDDISIIKPKGSNIKAIISDFKERNLYIGLSKDFTKSDRDFFSKKAKEYEEKYKKASLLDDLDKYKRSSYMKKYDDKYKNLSYLDFKQLESMDKDKLKHKLSITSSKHNILKTMLSDYKKKKFSLTGLFSKSKVDMDKLDKEKIQKLIELYKDKKKKSFTFVKQSKIKQLKSDLRAKLAGIN